MRLFRRDAAPQPPTFEEWVLRHVAGRERTGAMAFVLLERVHSNAGTLTCGVAFAAPFRFRPQTGVEAALAKEATPVARQAREGFRASLADRRLVRARKR